MSSDDSIEMRRRRKENLFREFNQLQQGKESLRDGFASNNFEVLSNTYSNGKSSAGPGLPFLGKRETRIVEVQSDGDPIIETQNASVKRPRRYD